MQKFLKYAEHLVKWAAKMRDDEATVVEQLRLMVTVGGNELPNLLGVPPVTQHAFEFCLPDGAGRVDLVLFHEDGGVTLVEAKGPGDTRSLAGGIGQLFVYAGAIQRMRFGGRVPTSVGMFLAAPVSADESEAVCRACELAGVGFVRLPPAKYFKFLLMNAMGMSYA